MTIAIHGESRSRSPAQDTSCVILRYSKPSRRASASSDPEASRHDHDARFQPKIKRMPHHHLRAYWAVRIRFASASTGKRRHPVLLTVHGVRPEGGANDAGDSCQRESGIQFLSSNGLRSGLREIHSAESVTDRNHRKFSVRLPRNIPFRCDGYPLFARLFERPHIELRRPKRQVS